MNMMEKQMQMGRDLMELNTEWFRKIAEFDGQNFQKYVDMNQEFAQRLPQIRDIQGFVDLQREYGEALWNNTQEVFKARNDMLREAMDANGEVMRGAWSTEEPVAEKKPAAKKTAAASAAA